MRATSLAGSHLMGGPLLSALLHAAAVVLLFAVSTHPRPAVEAVRRILLDPLIAPPARPTSNPGGGGGTGAATPASLGVPPRAALRQFTPPAAEIVNTHPVLPVEPTLVAPEEGVLQRIDIPLWGLPNGVPSPPSGGPGRGGGIGDGDGTGVGSGHGPRYGSGDGPGARYGRTVSGAATPPTVLWMVEPEYSEDARKAKVQGVVILAIEIDERGAVGSVQIRHGLGLGLDERAAETVRRWKFRPGTRDGRPIPTTAIVHVNFRLL